MKTVIRNVVSLAVIALVMGGVAASCRAEGWTLSTLGVRGGFSANDKSTSFEQIEAVGTLNLPWRWQGESGWWAQTRLAITAGRLRGRDDDGFVGSIGPNLTAGFRDCPLHLDLGVSPTGLSRWEYGTMDFGIPFQFTSYAGVNCELGKHFGLGYRYQHMSNAGLSCHNPGLNLHAFSIYYRF